MSRTFQTTSIAFAVTLMLAACGGGNNASQEPEAIDLESTQAQQPAMSDDAPLASSLAAPESTSTRESAMATTCTAPTYSTPQVAAWDMSRDESATRQALLARFRLSVVNLPADGARIDAFAQGVKSRNANASLAQYVGFPDVRTSPASTDYAYALAQEANARGWWLKNGSGTNVSWTSGTTTAINMTSWAPANPSGQRFPQFKAAHDHKLFLANTTGLDYVFTANTWARPRVNADWRRNGTDQSRMDTTIQSAMRAGYAAYWSSLRSLKPSVKIIGGTDNANNLSSPEYAQQLEGAFLDGMIGKSWSLEAVSGWSAMMDHYAAAMANTKADKKVIFSVYGSSPTDYSTMRFGLASALMNNGLFLFVPASGSQTPAWYDEYSAQLGAAAEAPPTAPAQNGIYMRRFENGLVLVNPSKTTSASISVGAGYKRLSGSQDPAVNNGAEQSTVTLGPRQGLVMLKVPPVCTEPPPPAPAPTPTTFATPRVAALDYSRDTSTARKELLAKYKFVILNFTKTMGSAKLQAMASELKSKNPGMSIAQYILVQEARCDSDPSQDSYAVTTEVHKNNWWLRNALGQRVQWTTVYDNCDVNVSAYSAKNARGQTYAQFKWEHDYNTWFKDAPAVDYVFIDNFIHKTRNPADWKRIGVDLPAGNEEAGALLRSGMATFANTVRATVPRMKVMGNVNHDLSPPEYKEALDGAFIEGLIGKAWSKETWAGWVEMMKVYRGALTRTNVRGNVFLNTFATPTDYKTIRYGLASAMIDDGYFLHVPMTGTAQPSWVDDYSAPIGDAAEPAPTAAAQNGIWMRRYTNGLVLVNPSATTTASINVGAGYKRLTGTQDPTVNNGKAESTVTLAPRTGLLMIKQ